MIARGQIFLLGLSHHTADIGIREKVAVTEESVGEVLTTLRGIEGLDEVLVVSTCNRVEVYGVRREEAPEVIPAVRAFLCARDPVVDRHLYEKEGTDALRHLFRVCASLDSMVVGEPQILGQMKEAFARAEAARAVGGILARSFRRAFGVAKRVRTETQIGQSAVSVGYAAVQLAKQVLGQVEGRTILLVGAGKMGALTARHLLGAGGSHVLVTNRSFERGAALAAEVGGEAHRWEELPQLLQRADVVVCSTAAPEPVITRELALEARRARKHRPLFLIDLAVPRDVDPRVNELEGIYLFDIDDLDQAIDHNLRARREEALRAEGVVEAEAEAFFLALRSEATPILRELRRRAEAVAQAEVARTLARRGRPVDAEEKRGLEAMARAIVNKLLHEPSVRIREAGEQDDGELLVAARRLFGLEARSEDRAVVVAAPPAGEAAARPAEAADEGQAKVARLPKRAVSSADEAREEQERLAGSRGHS